MRKGDPKRLDYFLVSNLINGRIRTELKKLTVRAFVHDIMASI